MADEEKLSSEKRESLTMFSKPLEGKRNTNGHLEARYSLEESEEIGRIVMGTLKSQLNLCFSKVDVENVKSPHVKAWKYIEETHALQMLEDLLSMVVYERPDDPLQFMINEVKKMTETPVNSDHSTAEDAETECSEKVQE